MKTMSTSFESFFSNHPKRFIVSVILVELAAVMTLMLVR